MIVNPIARSLVAALSLLVLVSASPAQKEPPDDGFMIFERRGCFNGICPTFIVYFFEDGRLIFDGKLAVAEGVHQITAPRDIYAQVARELEALGAMDDSRAGGCPSWRTHTESGLVTRFASPEHRRVDFDLGCYGYDNDDEFFEQVLKIERLLPIHDWVGERFR